MHYSSHCMDFNDQLTQNTQVWSVFLNNDLLWTTWVYSIYLVNYQYFIIIIQQISRVPSRLHISLYKTSREDITEEVYILYSLPGGNPYCTYVYRHVVSKMHIIKI